MVSTELIYPEPILIRYEGINAADHRVDLGLLGQSLQGASRLIAVSAHISLTGTYISRVPALSVRVLAGQPREHCYEVPAYVGSVIPFLPLLSQAGRAAGKRAVEAIVNYILSKLGGSPKEAELALHVAEQAIAANRDVTVEALDVVREVIRAGGSQRAAAKAFAAAIGTTAAKATLGEIDSTFVLDVQAKKQIDQVEEIQIGPAQPFVVRISELDTVNGSCKVEVRGDEPGSRIDGTIADPVVNVPHSPYSAALDSQYWITVIAKPHIRNGEVQKLTISDTANQ